MATPVNSRLPVISGIAEVDRVLECHPGTWSESPTYTYQWKNAGSPISGATGKLYLVDATDQGDAITCTVTATSGVDSDTATTAAVTPGAANYAAGYRATYNAGTDGDWFVDQATGDDGNAGTSTGAAFETIGAAVSAASGGDTIRVRSGTYRETVDLSSLSGTAGNPTRLLGYADEKPVVTGADALTGWTQCDSGDEATVGSNYASIYKKSVTTANIASGNPRAAFLHEDGTALQLVMRWLPNPKYPLFPSVPEQWLTADEVVLDESDLIQGYRLPSVTDDYTAAQIENCDIFIHHTPNEHVFTSVADFDTGTDTIVLTDQTYEYEDNENRDKFALQNLLPAMSAGTWGWKDNGDSTTTLYIWPNDTGNLTANIEYSTRGKCIVTANAAEHVIIGNLEVRQTASAGTATDREYAISAPTVSKKDGVRVENVLIENTWRLSKGYAPLWVQSADNSVVQCVTVRLAIGQYGIFIQGGSSGSGDLGMAADGWLDSCLIELSENSPIRLFTQRGHITSFCVARDCGMAAHANKSNYYSSCQNCMWYGCNFLGASGYLTWSAASAVSIVACVIPTNYGGGDNRAIQDQNRETGPTPASELTESGAGYVLNNIILPYVGAAAATNSMNIGVLTRPEVTFTVHNNVIHGYAGTEMDQVDAWDYNLLTAGSTDGANDDTDTLAAMYEDYAAGDYELKAGAAIRTMTAKDLSTEIGVLETRYPNFYGFDRDMNGNVLDWSSPPIGPVDDYDQDYDFDPVWVDYPEITGLPITGQTLGVSSGFLAASPYPTLSYQWQRSDDGITWANITDETSSTYDSVEGDGGKYLGCQVTPAGGSAALATTANTMLVGSYPIGDPSLLDTETASSVTQIETSAVTAANKPILAVIAFKATTTPAVVTATIGTAARSYGTGDSLTQAATSVRSSTQQFVFWIKDPGTGSKTVQVSLDQTATNIRVDLIEIEGVDTIGTAATGGSSSGTSDDLAVTTVASNSTVLHILTRLSGDDGDPLGITGATEIAEGNDGGTNAFGNQRTITAYELAVSTAEYGATVSWTTSKLHTWLSVELKSATVVTPTVTTADATFITSSSATLGGNVTDDGGGIIIEQGVCWGLTENPTVDDFKATSATGVGAFTVNATGMSDDTPYHHRAFVRTTVDLSYGTDKTFETLAADETDPTVDTATIAINGEDVTLGFSEDVTAEDWSGFSISGTDLTYASGTGTDTILFTADSTLTSGTKTLDYDPPVDGVQDGAGNLLAPIDGMAVTNNVPSEGGGSDDGGLVQTLARPLAGPVGGTL